MISDGKRNKGGQPKKLTPEKQDVVVSIISSGGSRKMAAKAVGIAVSTIQHETKRNPEFLDRIREAESTCYVKHLKKIHGSRDWKASAWFLARKYPEEFAELKKHAEVDSQGRDLSPEQRERAIQSILAKRFNGSSEVSQ